MEIVGEVNQGLLTKKIHEILSKRYYNITGESEVLRDDKSAYSDTVWNGKDLNGGAPVRLIGLRVCPRVHFKITTRRCIIQFLVN